MSDSKTTALTTTQIVQNSLKKRYRAERRFKAFGIASVCVGVFALMILFTEIISKGVGAFTQTYVKLELTLDNDVLGIDDISNPDAFMQANYTKVIRNALKAQFPTVKKRRDRRALYGMVSVGASYKLQAVITKNPDLIGTTQTFWVIADDDVDTYYKSLSDAEPFTGRMNDKQQAWVQTWVDNSQIKRKFNTTLFTAGDSSEPELAGILGALVGSLLTLSVTLILSFPIGVAAAVYLEEYAKRNKITDFIEVNINNLAAVPSVIFGLLGLAIFLNFFGMPRSIPLVGGLVLTLMTLPTIIISSRAAIKAVPPSIREAALGMGASKMQMILHHVIPLAMPGMLTGAIIGLAQALGETAPLLMIGMVAFIVDVPTGITDAATVLPVQIFLWADSPERAFVERTSAAIMVLLVFLISMNGIAIWLRKRLERRW